MSHGQVYAGALIALLSAPAHVALASPTPLTPEYVVEDDGWFTVAYHPSARERVRVMMPRISEIRAELRGVLGSSVLEHVEIRVAALDSEMSLLGPIEKEGAETHHGGASFGPERLVVLSAGPALDGTERDLEVIARYHLARLALLEALTDSVAPPAAAPPPPPPKASSLPAWFADGFATNFAHEGEGGRAAQIMVSNALGRMPHLADLERSGTGDDDDQAAAFAAEFARFVGEAENGQALSDTLQRMRKGTPFDEALASAVGGDKASIDRAFRKDVAKKYVLFPVLFVSALLWTLLAMVGWFRRRRRVLSARATSRFLEARPTRSVRAKDIREPVETRVEPVAEAVPIPISGGKWVRIDVAVPTDSATAAEKAEPKAIDVPTIEHDGGWHTLH